MASARCGVLPGAPYPLGATWDGLGTNFALFSAHADPRRALPVRPVGTARDRALRRCPNSPTRSGTATCPMRAPACSTATASMAPTTPRAGHRFNHHKLLLDPYATALAGELRSSDALFGYRDRLAARRPLLRPPRQRAAACPNAWSADDSFNWADDRPPDVPWARHRHLRGACARPHHAAATTSGRPSAAPSPPSPTRTSSTICGGSASPRSS